MDFEELEVEVDEEEEDDFATTSSREKQLRTSAAAFKGPSPPPGVIRFETRALHGVSLCNE